MTLPTFPRLLAAPLLTSFATTLAAEGGVAVGLRRYATVGEVSCSHAPDTITVCG